MTTSKAYPPPARGALGVDVGGALNLVGSLVKYLGAAFLFPAAIAVGYGDPVWPFLVSAAITTGASTTSPARRRSAPTEPTSSPRSTRSHPM